MLVALVATAASTGALLVGAYTASLQRHHDRAEVWPHLELALSLSPEGATISVVNSGIGPAVIQSVGATLDGKPIASWDQLAQALVDHPLRAYSASSLADRVIRAGEAQQVLTIPASELSSTSRRALTRASVSVCYASVFDERWLVRTPALTGRSEWRSVDRCPTNDRDSQL